eukprot:363905-Chlamydomonas_euryale.AAC.4
MQRRAGVRAGSAYFSSNTGRHTVMHLSHAHVPCTCLMYIACAHVLCKCPMHIPCASNHAYAHGTWLPAV